MSSTTDTTAMSITDRIRGLIESDAIELPPLPQVALKLKSMLDRDEADARQVSKLIETEPAMVASVMRVANSAAFGGLRPVPELPHAIARLGMKQVNSIVTALAIKGHFETESPGKKQALQALWDHSIGTAFCARQIAIKIREDADQAFLAGLLHDVGQLLVLRAVDHLEADPSFEMPITETVLAEMMRDLHPTLGHQALMQWRLPEPVCHAALNHEDDDEQARPPLLMCVQAAIAVTRKLGLHRDPDPELNLLADPTVESLGVSDIELAELMIDLEDEILEVRSLF